MRDSLSAIAIVVAVIFTCNYTANLTTEHCESIKESVEDCIEASEKGDWNDAESFASDLREQFEEKEHALEVFHNHEDIRRLRDSISKIQAGTRLQNPAISITEATSLLRQLETLAASDKLSLSNLF